MINITNKGRRDLTIGIVAGTFSGLCVLIGQSLSEAYKLGLLVSVSFALILMFAFIIRINWHTKSK